MDIPSNDPSLVYLAKIDSKLADIATMLLLTMIATLVAASMLVLGRIL